MMGFDFSAGDVPGRWRVWFCPMPDCNYRLSVPEPADPGLDDGIGVAVEQHYEQAHDLKTEPGNDFSFSVWCKQPSGWRVELPHQCGPWMVVGGAYGDEGVSHLKSIAELDRFIREAQNALDHLVAGVELRERH